MTRSVRKTAWLAIAALAVAGSLGPSVARAAEQESRSVPLPPKAAREAADAKSDQSAGKTPATPKPLNPRVLFITAKDVPESGKELARMCKAGGDFEQMRACGWTIGEGADKNVQIVDRDKIPDLVKKLKPKEYPAVACIDGDDVVRSFSSGCTTPLDAWTIGFLAKGTDERPPGSVSEEARVQSTGHYPLRGNHWSVETDWNPTRAKVIEHLHGPNHAWQLKSNWRIEDWSYEELRSLHDDLHESEPGSGSSQPTSAFPALGHHF